MENDLINFLNKKREEYIKSKGIPPDTVYFNEIAKEYKGKIILGMVVKTSNLLNVNQIIILNSTLIALI